MTQWTWAGIGSDSFSFSPIILPKYTARHMYCMKYCYNNYIINIINRLCNRQVRNTYTHALAYRWQLTMQGEVGAGGRVTKSSQCFGKSCILAEFCLYWYLWAWLSVVVMFEAYNKSVPLSMCVCIAETARVRYLKVILLLVLGRHECVRGKCYININKLVFF